MSAIQEVKSSKKNEHQSKVVMSVQNSLLTVLTYVILLMFLFPLIWMILAGFKTEAQAFSTPPIFFFTPTFENFSKALETYAPFLKNSLIIVGGSTLLAFILGVPAGFAMALYPGAEPKEPCCGCSPPK